MAIDIRRCSKEDLDRLNEEGREWRERNKAAHVVASDTSLKLVAETQEEPHVLAPETISQPVQLNLFGGEEP